MFLERRGINGGRTSTSTRSTGRPRPGFRPWAMEQLEARLVLSAPTTLAVFSASGTYGGTTSLSAQLTSGGVPIAGESVDFHIGSTDLGPAVTDTTGTATLNNSQLIGINAGSYTGDVTASFEGDLNFDPASGAGDLTVTPAPLTITANNLVKVYGAAVPTLTVSYSGFVNGDTAASLDPPTINTAATAASHVAGSPYAITASGAADPNYTISYVSGNLTVTTAPLTITADNASKIYGSALPTLTASYTGLVNGDTSASFTTPPTITTTATAASHVAGNPYSITASGAVDSDYAISYVSGSLSVTTAPLTITASNQIKVYGAALPTLSASYSGFVNGDTSASLGNSPTINTTATAASHVAGNPYAITASGAVDSDYTISYVAGSLNVTAAPLTITADNQSKMYGSALPALTASYSGLVNGDTSASLSTPPTLNTAATAASHVAGNPYAITASGAVDSDYTISYVDGSLNVTAAPLTITADNQTKVYGSALPALTASYSGFVNGDTSASLSTPPSLNTAATAASHVAGNPYAITASGAVDGDYIINYVAGSLSVTAAPLTITADSQTKVYGSALPTLTASYSGLVNGDTSASFATPPTISTAATAASHVAGSPYAITASGAVDGDYVINYVAGSLNVTAAPLTITGAHATKVYGAALPTLSASYTGFVNGDTEESLTTLPTITTTATAASHVSGIPYDVNASGAVDPDYAITYAPGTLNVTPAPLAITAGNATKVYGAAVPVLSASYSGFVNGDTSASLLTQPTVSTGATAASHVSGSPYAVDASGAVDLDYTFVYIPGTLTVTPASLVVTADPQTKGYGAAVPTLTASYTGFVNGDTAASLAVAPKFSTTATAGSGVEGSPYGIFVGGAVDSDYAIQYNNGILSVTPVALKIVANDLNKVYGAAVPTLTASYTGFVNGDTAASLTTRPTLTTTATAASHVSGYAITVAGAADPNYFYLYTAGTLNVTPAPLTVTADNATKPFIGPLPTFSASYKGFVNGDTPATSLAVPTSFSTSATSSSPAGTYPINPGGERASDYSITNVAGTLTVQGPIGPMPTPPTPSGNTAADAFVNSLYHDLLGRAPEASGFNSWTTQMSQGARPLSIAMKIFQTPEAQAYRASHRGGAVSFIRAFFNARQAERFAGGV